MDELYYTTSAGSVRGSYCIQGHNKRDTPHIFIKHNIHRFHSILVCCGLPTDVEITSIVFRQGHGSFCCRVGLSVFRVSLPDSFHLFKTDVAFKHDISFTLGSLKRPNVKVCTGLSFAVLNVVSLTAVEGGTE